MVVDILALALTVIYTDHCLYTSCQTSNRFVAAIDIPVGIMTVVNFLQPTKFNDRYSKLCCWCMWPWPQPWQLKFQSKY